MAGDLFIHLLTGIHHATGAIGPTRVDAMGGQRYWKMAAKSTTSSWACLTIPRPTPTARFTLSLCTDFEDGGGGGTAFRFVGTEGVIDVSFKELNFTRMGIEHATADQILKGYNSVTTFSNAQQKAFADKLLAEHPSRRKKSGQADREICRSQGL